MIRTVFLLVETFIGIREKQFSKKKLILASGQLISRVLETIFFSTFQRLLLMIVFFSSIGKVFLNEIFHLLVETYIRANNDFHKQKNKRILSPSDKNSESISQNERFVKKIRFHYAEKKLFSPAGISKNKPSKMVSGSRREVTKFKNGVHQQKKVMNKYKVCNLPEIRFHLSE